ncbi:MAG: hypothetical protein ACTHOK_05055, partial [Nocardioidaceae bacterium]
MPARTATFSSRSAAVRRSVADLGPLLRFRAATIRGRARVGVPVAFGVILAVTVGAAWLPAYVVAPRFAPQ